jgi:hypothetical protein
LISATKKPKNLVSDNDDFTHSKYRDLIRLAKKKWQFSFYDQINWDSSFVLWRHDVDYSLNNSLKLAKIESEEGVKSTFFINPHCTFYNIFEGSQRQIIREILRLGHQIGIHLDTKYYEDISKELDLINILEEEASLIKSVITFKPNVFSFHNPTAKLMEFSKQNYGTFINCYSKKLSGEIGYCSDSNGYWRYDRAFQLIKTTKEKRFQMLTHPGWWQKIPMTPRQRIFHSIYGRANNTLSSYDKELELNGRINHSGNASKLLSLKKYLKTNMQLFDFLWNKNSFDALSLELWILYLRQLRSLCKYCLISSWKLNTYEVDKYIEKKTPSQIFKLFFALFSKNSKSYKANNKFEEFINIENSIKELTERSFLHENNEKEATCVQLCGFIEKAIILALENNVELEILRACGNIDNVNNSFPKNPHNEKKSKAQTQKSSWHAFYKYCEEIMKEDGFQN